MSDFIMDRRSFSLCAVSAAALPTLGLRRAAAAVPKLSQALVLIAGKDAKTFPMSEWDVVQQAGGEQAGSRVLIAEGEESVEKAPANASRYLAKSYKFPSGAVRILSWAKGQGPVIHQVTFETELYVLEGAVDMEIRGNKTRLNAGDAASMPSGVLRNMKPKGNTVVLQFFVANTLKDAEAMAVRGKDLDKAMVVQWQADGKAMSVGTYEEAKKAPQNAARYFVKRYAFQGNSIRLATLKKGGRTNIGTATRSDVLIYVSKGRMRRTEGDQTFEVVAGDAVREVLGMSGYWELLEDSEFLATDAPFNPNRAWANP